jgi:hypothetical protein
MPVSWKQETCTSRLKEPRKAESALGYREVMLDTLPWMTSAIAIYRSLGFAPISPYWNNLVPGIIYFGKPLRSGETRLHITPGDLTDPRVP